MTGLGTDAGFAENAVATVRRHARRIIDEELARLARRSQALRATDLAMVDHALEEVLDRLILDRVRRVASVKPELLDSAVRLLDPAASVTLPVLPAGERAVVRRGTEDMR
ncbi:hypothetical protein [Actinopolymorpha alba]|uniref:hypothetical protein n=1 Tax=Actinopolymorpha alba TaxID=533267 RepID=UPI00036B8AA5|nr:hypothetical protein [Actinopolymorpha alba]